LNAPHIIKVFLFHFMTLFMTLAKINKTLPEDGC